VTESYCNSARSAPAPPVKIEAVTVCVGYADFLAHSLPINKAVLDRIVVVTAPEDKDTQRVCDTWGIRYYRTDSIRSRWGEFHKARGINEGLRLLDRDAWIVHIDADTILPAHFHDSVARADFDTSMVYGLDRMECQSYEEWQRYFGSPEPPIQGNGIFIHTTHAPFKIGTRVQFPDSGGWIPIGFFQMWHHDADRDYPENHSSAGKTDSQFARLWPRRKRGFIPEVIAYHLESEQAPMAVNWQGRKTKRFHIDDGPKERF
jgi:hypothetical protein